MSDRIVFVPDSTPAARPKRVEDKPLRPTPVSVNDDREERWTSQKNKRKSSDISSELRKALRRFIFLGVIAGGAGGLLALVNSVMSFYGISLW